MAKDRNNLTNGAVKIDGQYIEDAIAGYTTLSTKGREAMPRELETVTVGTTDGERIKRTRYPARTITVEFLIRGIDSSDLIKKMNHLNNLLSIEEADFVFNDEPDKYFTGTAIMPSEIERGLRWVHGEYQIYCAYPFKRSTAVFTAIPTTINDHDAEFVFNYQGTYPSKPVLVAEFAGALSGGDYSDDGDCGYIAFIDGSGNIIQLGNPDAIDIDAFTSADTLMNRLFTTIDGFNTSGGKTWGSKAISGAVSGNQSITDTYWGGGAGQTLQYVKPTGYGTGDAWHGPILWQATQGAINFELSIVHRLCVSAVGQVGTFECGAYNLTNDTLTMVAGIVIEKTASGTNGTVRYIVNGKSVKTETIDLSFYNTHFGYCNRTEVYKTQYYNKKKKKWQDKKIKSAKTRKVVSKYNYTQSNLNTKIVKSGNGVTFKVGNLAEYKYTDNEIEQLPAHNVSFHFGQSKTAAVLHTNAVRSVKFVRNPSANFLSIPNVFTSGDVVEADCYDASIYIKSANTEIGHEDMQYGALGNDWEDFSLQQGMNTVKAVWSDWVNTLYKPAVKILYNEVYL